MSTVEQGHSDEIGSLDSACGFYQLRENNRKITQ